MAIVSAIGYLTLKFILSPWEETGEWGRKKKDDWEYGLKWVMCREALVTIMGISEKKKEKNCMKKSEINKDKH